MKTMRLRKFVNEILDENGPMTTGEILDAYNQHSKFGTTMQQLGNVLSKCPEFIQVDFIETIGRARVRNAVWDMKEVLA
jgi:hypothetical protein